MKPDHRRLGPSRVLYAEVHADAVGPAHDVVLDDPVMSARGGNGAHLFPRKRAGINVLDREAFDPDIAQPSLYRGKHRFLGRDLQIGLFGFLVSGQAKMEDLVGPVHPGRSRRRPRVRLQPLPAGAAFRPGIPGPEGGCKAPCPAAAWPNPSRQTAPGVTLSMANGL